MRKYVVFIIISFASQIAFSQFFHKYIQEEAKLKVLSFQHLKTKSGYNIGTNYDLYYSKFYFDVDPNIHYIKAEVTHHFIIIEDNVNLISFELSDSLKIDSIIYKGQKVQFTHKNKKLDIKLNTILNKNQQDSVLIYYQGKPQTIGGFSSFEQQIKNDLPMLWTLSQPYGSSDWWPCKNSLNDKIDSIDVFIKTPAKYKAVSNGILINIYTNNEYSIYHWKHKYPIETYLIAIAVSDYETFTDEVQLKNGKLKVENYIYKINQDSVENIKKYIRDFLPFMRLYDTLLTPYPFSNEKYGHAHFDLRGGMEHQTTTFVGWFSIDLLIHEYIHSWFGNMVTCKSWQDIWLNEGLTTYFTAVSYQMTENQRNWQPWLRWTKEYITLKPYGSVFCYDTTNIHRIFDDRLTYYKGAFVCHMLRYVVGDEIFFRAIRNYLTDKKLMYNYARTKDLKEHFEKLYGKNLDWFFNQWLYGEGYPSYEISLTYVKDNVFNLNIKQTQSNPSVEFFKMPVEITFSNFYYDTTITIWNTHNNQDTLIKLSFIPTKIEFDKNTNILSRNNTITLNAPESFNNEIKIFPNPSTDKIYIQNINVLPCNIEIYNTSGQLVHKKEITSTNDMIINIENLKKGMYFLKLHNTQINILHKIFIE